VNIRMIFLFNLNMSEDFSCQVYFTFSEKNEVMLEL
jgi:hypothetical protein